MLEGGEVGVSKTVTMVSGEIKIMAGVILSCYDGIWSALVCALFISKNEDEDNSNQKNDVPVNGNKVGWVTFFIYYMIWWLRK